MKRLPMALAAVCALVVVGTAGAAGSIIVAKAVNVTNSLYAGTEESLGMSPA